VLTDETVLTTAECRKAILDALRSRPMTFAVLAARYPGPARYLKSDLRELAKQGRVVREGDGRVRGRNYWRLA
jgi:DNA-binding HxlR family transcriptional regulator